MSNFPWRLVNHKTNPTVTGTEFSSTGTPSIDISAIPPKKGNLMIASLYGTAVTPTLTPQGNLQTAISYNGTKAIGGCIICYKISVGTETSVQINQASAPGSLIYQEWEGNHPVESYVLDTTGTSERSATGTTLSVSTSLPTTMRNELVIAVVMHGGSDGGAETMEAKASGVPTTTIEFDALEGAHAYGILTVPGIVTMNSSWPTSQLATHVIATFRGNPYRRDTHQRLKLR